MANPSEFVPEGVSDLPWEDRREGVIYDVAGEVVARVDPSADDDDYIFPANAAYIAHSASQYRKACELLDAVDLRCMTPGALHIGGADCSQLTGEREHWCPPCQARAFLSAAREFGKGGR